jgi:hypothetical protein
MRELLKKAWSLTFAAGALSLVMINAAVNHGCGGARPPESVSQAAPPSVTPRSEPDAGADSGCEEPSYMHATKAPVWTWEDHCRRKGNAVKGATEPPAPSNALLPSQQQAP